MQETTARFVTTWVDLEGIMCKRNKSDRGRKILHDLTYMWNLKKPNSEKQRVEWWLPGAGGWG